MIEVDMLNFHYFSCSCLSTNNESSHTKIGVKLIVQFDRIHLILIIFIFKIRKRKLTIIYNFIV